MKGCKRNEHSSSVFLALKRGWVREGSWLGGRKRKKILRSREYSLFNKNFRMFIFCRLGAQRRTEWKFRKRE